MSVSTCTKGRNCVTSRVKSSLFYLEKKLSEIHTNFLDLCYLYIATK